MEGRGQQREAWRGKMWSMWEAWVLEQFVGVSN